MSNQTPKTPQSSSEEVDLDQLFHLIGNGFRKIARFFRNMLNSIFNAVILFLLFIQKHFLKFVISGIVGLAIGIYLDINKERMHAIPLISLNECFI